MKQIISESESKLGGSVEAWRSERPPLEPSGQLEARSQVEPALEPSKTILVVDDDAAVRQMLGRVLESEQYTVLRAKTGREAAVLFLSAPPDLVLLDLNMPDRDGWEAFHLINAVNPMIPVIIITARPNQYEHATRLGVDALMEKPLDLSLLLGTIGRLLAESEAERVHRVNHPYFKTLHLNQPPKVP